MDATTRIKLTIGDLLVQVATLAARIEELEAQLKEKSDGHDHDNPVGLSSGERNEDLHGQ